MDTRRHQLLNDLFRDALRCRGDERKAMLAERRATDPELVDEVEDLLRRHESEDTSDWRLDPLLTPTLGERAVADAESEHAQASPSAAGPALPRRIGRYTIVRELGAGGMGVVYLAEQDAPRRTVALKVMRQPFGRIDERLRRRFAVETQVLGRLEHPGIARIYDAGAGIESDDGVAAIPYFAMEFVDGLPLLEYARKHELGTRDRMRLLERVCDAVASAHRLGVVHRDLKPQNILVDATEQPKVLDFGIARCTDSDIAVTTVHTDVGQLVGTLPYMSPEQVAGDVSRLDARCDVYALGAVAYELLTGELPLNVRELPIAEAARVIRDEDPVPLSSISRVFRGDLETIVAKALEKEPSRRYASAEELGADIRRYLADEPIVARPAGTVYQLRKFAQRNRILVGGVVATILMLALGLAGTTWGLFRAAEERDAARAAEGRAQHRFQELRALARTFIYDFHDMIADLPGSTPAREKLVVTALTYLDGLAAEAADDPALQQELAEAYMKVGQVQGYYSKANLGDPVGAMESFRKALTIRERLVTEYPTSRPFLRSLTTTQNHIANLHFNQGRFEDALDMFQQVLAVRQRLLAEAPPDSKEHREYQRDVSISHQWIGNTLKELDRLDEALAAYESQFELAKELARPDDPMSMRDLSVAYEKLGDLKRSQNRPDAALEDFKASLDIRRGMAEAESNNAEASSDLGVSLSKLGTALIEMDRPQEAVPYIEEGDVLFQRMADADPVNALAQRNLIVSKYRLGVLNAAIAERPGTSPERRRELLAVALDYHRESLRLLQVLEDRGALEGTMTTWPRDIGKAADELEAALRAAEKK
ncbi:MAG: protein kinase [Phycisphaerales bacterium]|nr:protein kinase [Phycisphaerales bacterium]